FLAIRPRGRCSLADRSHRRGRLRQSVPTPRGDPSAWGTPSVRAVKFAPPPLPPPQGAPLGVWGLLKKRVLGRAEAPEPATASAPTAKSPATSTPPSKPKAAPPPPGPQPSDFLPIAREDLLKQGEDVRRNTGWMWFGRRDLIPLASDPRTL